MTSAPGALARLLVLDLSRVLAGPWASQLLGHLGADVIKVERPAANGKGGHDTRRWGPPWLADGEGSQAAVMSASPAPDYGGVRNSGMRNR